MSQRHSKWDEAVWSLPVTNQMIAEMLNELLGYSGMDGVAVDLVTHVAVAPEDGLVTFYFTHTRPPGRVLQLVPDETAAPPRRIPVKGGPGGEGVRNKTGAKLEREETDR
jgi:hypothetical protein